MDRKTLDLRLAQFEALKTNIPSFIKEDFVNEYNNLVNDLAIATGEVLTQFQIQPSAVKPKVVAVRPRSYDGRPGGAMYSNDKYCDDNLFNRRIQSLSHYLDSLGVRRGQSAGSSSRYDDLLDSQLQELMIQRRIKPPMPADGSSPKMPSRDFIIALLVRQDEGKKSTPPESSTTTVNIFDSNVNWESPGASIEHTEGIDLKSPEFANLIAGLKELIKDARFSEAERAQVNADLQTVEIQIGAPRPNRATIKEHLLSVKHMLEHAGGALIAHGIVATLHYVLSTL